MERELLTALLAQRGVAMRATLVSNELVTKPDGDDRISPAEVTPPSLQAQLSKEVPPLDYPAGLRDGPARFNQAGFSLLKGRAGSCWVGKCFRRDLGQTQRLARMGSLLDASLGPGAHGLWDGCDHTSIPVGCCSVSWQLCHVWQAGSALKDPTKQLDGHGTGQR